MTERCGWAECDGCAALVAFTAKWEAGEAPPRLPVTSPWWDSDDADAVYRRGVNLPPCDHVETLWP